MGSPYPDRGYDLLRGPQRQSPCEADPTMGKEWENLQSEAVFRIETHVEAVSYPTPFHDYSWIVMGFQISMAIYSDSPNRHRHVYPIMASLIRGIYFVRPMASN